MTIEVVPGSTKYPDTLERAALYDRIFERVRPMPGTGAASTSALPLTCETWVDAILRRDRAVSAAARPSAGHPD